MNKFLLSGFQLLKRLAKLVLTLIKKRKMTISGNEGVTYNEQQTSDGVQNYSNSFGQDPSYTNFEIMGVNFIQNLLDVDLAKGLKFKNIIDETGQTAVCIVPVDANGNEIEVPVVAAKDAPGGIRCPSSC